MIYYFTGTGNSEFAAKRIAGKTGMQTVPVYEYISEGKIFEPVQGETLVFVTPTHGWRIPRIVSDWIKAGSFDGAHKAYFVMTCGSEIGDAGKHCKALCDECGFELMGVGEVVMPENYVAMFYVPGEDEAKAIVEKAVPVIDGYAELIAEGKPLEPKKISLADKLKSGIVNDAFYAMFVKADKFYATDKCISCGLCAVSCLTHNIELKNGKPTWSNRCVHCMKCICDCPEAAIEYGKASIGKPRYHCPDIGEQYAESE